MKAPKPYSLLLTVLLSAGAVQSARAGIISINFDNNLDVGSALMEPTDLAGAPGVRVGNWNPWLKNDGILGDAGQVIVDDSGSSVAGFTATGSFSWASRDNDDVNDTAMFSDIVDVNTSTRIVNITNVPYDTYDVYVYMHDDDSDRAGEFVLGGDTYYMRGIGPGEHAGDPDSSGNGYVLSTDTTFGAGTDIDQANYVKFSGVTGAAFTMEWTAVNAGDATQRAKVAGFQIVESTPPATTATISINFDNNLDVGSALMETNDLAGAPGVRVGNWNPWLKNDLTLGDAGQTVVDDSGAAVAGFTADITPIGWASRNNNDVNDEALFSDIVDVTTGETISVTNVPFPLYDVYVYMRSDSDDRAGSFTIGATTYYMRGFGTSEGSGDPASDGSGYVQSSDTTLGAGTDIDQGNYVKFSSLTGSDFVLDLNVVNAGDGTMRSKVAGLQIAEKSTATVTNILLDEAIPTLLQGNSSGYGLKVRAFAADGTSTLVTTEPEVSYLSEDTSIFIVSSNGVISPNLAGTANVVISYDGSLFLTNPVTVIGPTSISLSLNPNTLFVGNGIGDSVQAVLTADFATQTGVDVSDFDYVSFGSTSGGVVSVSSGGLVTAVGIGSFDLVGNYAGLSTTNDPAGSVVAFVAPTGANAISVNIADPGNPLDYKALAGPPGSRFAYWNNFDLTGGSNQVSGLRDYQGNVIVGSVATITAVGFGTKVINPLLTNDVTMFRTFNDAGANNPLSYLDMAGIITVSNLPYAKYDVYFYTLNDNAAGSASRSGYFHTQEDDLFYTRKNDPNAPISPDSDGNGYVAAAPQVFNGAFGGNYPATIADVPAGNYIKVSGLTNSDLVVDWGATTLDYWDDPTGAEPSVQRLRFSGFQIVKSLEGLTATNVYLDTPVPDLLPGDPTTIGLIALADFNDGTVGGNITDLPGISFTSGNPSVFTVTAGGVVQAGTTPGVANLIVSYQSVSHTQAVTTLAPMDVRVVARPDTYYLDSVIGTDTGQASLVADFPGKLNVDISGFSGVTYSGPEPGVASVSSSGVITAVGAGEADITGNYLGTPYPTVDAATVTSVAAAPVLKHRWSFRDTGSTIKDSVGNVDGAVFSALSGFLDITLDGERAYFPGDSDYSTAPYVSFGPGLITERGDITIEMWVGVTELRTWARFLASGQTTKGTDPRNNGSGSGLPFLSVYASYAGTGQASLSYDVIGGSGTTDLQMTNSFGTGTERHLVAVYAPHRGVAKIYVDGVLHASNVPASSLTQLIDDVVWLGVSRWNDAPLGGWFNELRIHEGAFSDADVLASLAAGPNVGLPPAAAPSLSIELLGSDALLAWPTNAVGYVLKSNTVVNVPFTNWFPVGLAPTVIGTNNTVTVPAGSGDSFFILEK